MASSSSSLERTLSDLQTARLVVHKLGETVGSFQVHSYSIFTLVDQWRSCQASFAEVHKSLESKVKELECKERDIGVVANKLHRFRDEIELKRKRLEDGERLLSEKIKEVELRQNEVKKWMAVIEAQKRAISERFKVVEAKEAELSEGLERVKKVEEEEIWVRKAELEVNECRTVVDLEKSRLAEVAKDLESREERIDERCKKVELRQNVVDEHCKAVDLREKGLDERCKELELREREIKEREDDLGLVLMKIKQREEALEVEETRLDEKKRVMEAKEMRFMKDRQALELREHELDEVYSLLEQREIEFDETLKGVESKEKELILREEKMKVKHEDLNSKEKDIIEHLNGLNVKERDLKDGCRALEDKAKEINARFASLVAREEEVDKRNLDVEMKEKQVNAQCIVLEAREGILKEHWEMLELKGKDVDERGKAMESKEGEVEELRRGLEFKVGEVKKLRHELELKEGDVEELRRGLESKEMQMNADLQGLGLERKQIDEHCKELEVKEKEISDHYKEMEIKEKQMNRRKKALELREKQLENLSKELELKEKELKEPPQGLELKDNQFKVLSQEVGSKDKQLNDLPQAQASKEKQDNELSEMQERKEKHIIETSKALESKDKRTNGIFEGINLEKKQSDGHFAGDHDKASEFKDKEINIPVEPMVSSRSQLHGTQDLCVKREKGCSDKLQLKGKQMADGILNLKSNQTSNPRDIPVLKDGQKDNILHKSKEAQNAELHEVQSQENQVNDIAEKSEVGQKRNCESNSVVNSNGNESDTSTFSAMDGKTLLSYLNERISRHGFMKEEVVEILKATSNPAKLVLDAVDSFFAPSLNKDGVAFEANVARSSCLLLLEHLMDMNLRISPAIKKEATKVALKWKLKMKTQGESEVAVVAFLLLYIIYNLDTLFKEDELKRICAMVNQHRLAPRFRQRLGLYKGPNESSGFQDANKESLQSTNLQVSNAIDSGSAKISASIHSLCRSMDGHSVRSYLIEHVKEYKVLRDKILDALRHATDPAKLVLDVCRISTTDPDNNCSDVNNTACIFLLEQLLKLSPSIANEMTQEAKKFAEFLKARLKESSIPIDHHKFLQFIASYKLKNYYPPDELLSYLEVLYHGIEVYQPDETVYLCFVLGIAKKIPGVIKSFIDQQKLLLAVKYICVFKLEHMFPPVPLLEAHLEIIKETVDRRRKEGTIEAKIDAENMELMALKSVITCIYNFKLELKLAPERFVARIKELEKENERRLGAKYEGKRSANPGPSAETQLGKRPRVGEVQHGVAPVYFPQYPPGPPPRLHPFDTPEFVRQVFNRSNPHFNSPNAGPGRHGVLYPEPPYFLFARQYPVAAPTPSPGGNYQAWTTSNHWRC
ncbi:uncharacterized protein LOC141657512 [Silene latifolia]|uniref:uncharacterized protein LOC141657512 n=1 Tax=Silene latifolia TaxID=37657 RepID=UPI003D778AC1